TIGEASRWRIWSTSSRLRSRRASAWSRRRWRRRRIHDYGGGPGPDARSEAGEPVKRAEVTIVNRLGLHARPSAALTQLATRFAADVFLTKGTRRVNGKSIMGVMMLADAKGSVIVVETEGKDEEQALDALVALIASGFGEETTEQGA